MLGIAPNKKPKGIILNLSSAFAYYNNGWQSIRLSEQSAICYELALNYHSVIHPFLGIYVLIKRDKLANLFEITLHEQHLSPIIKTLFHCVIIFFITFRLLISSSMVFFHYHALFTAFARHFGCQSPCLLLSISRLTYSIFNVLPYYSFFLPHSTVGNNTFLCSLFRLHFSKNYATFSF